ncbi:MAG: ankyrin repeat domain-containing protein [Planctomycetota bacterium]|jgi:ankyrin repeat protein
MKLSLPLKLGIFVVVLFAAVIIACLLRTPVRIRYYSAKLKSDDPKEKLVGAEGLINIGEKGIDALAESLIGGDKAATLLMGNWDDVNKAVNGDIYKRTPLTRAIECRYEDVVLLLLAKGADVQKSHCLENINNVVGLMRNGCNGFYAGDTPLHVAVLNENIDIIRILISYGAKLHAPSSRKGWTPLYYSVYVDNVRVAEILIKNGADVNLEDASNYTPLMCAISEKMRGLLISCGARERGW